MSAYGAGCLGAHAADTVLNRIAGKEPAPVNLSYNAMCVSLGRRAAIFQFAHKDDTAKRLYLGGRPGATIKELACQASVKHLANEARKPGSHTWPKGELRQQLLASTRGEPLAGGVEH
jgi:hypothetical protein